MRLELEALQPQTGARKWAQIIRRSQRVAGRPRSVSAAIQVTMLTDFSADSSVDKQLRIAAKAAKEKFKMCAAYQETVWLDQKKLKKYLAEFRANNYQEPAGYKWIENREKNPNPYLAQG
jgi:arginyl-tRNA--protein-N-Asp/Glu arginylyltransferase